MANPCYPSIFEVNTRVWIRELSRKIRYSTTLDEISDVQLDHLASLGFDWIYLLGVWQTGEYGKNISRLNSQWRIEFQKILPDLDDSDICGSCFAIKSYTVHSELGGEKTLELLRQRLNERGLKPMLDFVPNHTAIDHPWIHEHPEFFVQGTEADIARKPGDYSKLITSQGPKVLAHGRDPYFPSWPDTMQLNYGHMPLQEAMKIELLKIAKLCDGVRCDLAMLILPDIFYRTWKIASEPFWEDAIHLVCKEFNEFIFMAEVYWDLESRLQQLGFHYTYDKRLYDRLRDRLVRPVRDHFSAEICYQQRMVRFLENHDEPRATETFPFKVHLAAAILTFLSPGLRFFHQGQIEGNRKKISVHLCRGPVEPTNPSLEEFYMKILSCLHHPAVRNGDWRLLECTPAWQGNWTWESFVAFAWQLEGKRLLITVNYSPY